MYYQLFPFDKEKYEVLVAFDKVELLSLKDFLKTYYLWLLQILR